MRQAYWIWYGGHIVTCGMLEHGPDDSPRLLADKARTQALADSDRFGERLCGDSKKILFGSVKFYEKGNA